jgi:protein-L-isoaspartate(D-aspartate) O-methyltransferase
LIFENSHNLSTILPNHFTIFLLVKREDNYRHKGLRKQLVKELRSQKICSEKILAAIEKVPRHFFLDSTFEQFAYTNKAFPIPAGQTISQPQTVAQQSELLNCSPGDKVLEIGTGSGYQCAVLCELGMKVYSIERQKELHNMAVSLLAEMGYEPTLYYGDGYKGKEVFAPYKGIIVTCGAPEAPSSLLGQLTIGGRLVIPVGDSGDGKKQRMLTYDRISETEFTKQDHGSAAFVPMLVSKSRG